MSSAHHFGSDDRLVAQPSKSPNHQIATSPDLIIGVGVIGIGFMGRTHVRAYNRAAADGFPCRLAAVCDVAADVLRGPAAQSGNIGSAHSAGDEHLFDPSSVHRCESADALFSRPDIGLVSICTYTDSHVDLAMRALDAGKHVLVEKPVALTSKEVSRLAEHARKSGKLCMPAMCMRFWPGWDWLRDRIRDRSFGEVRSATFQRLGAQPSWATAFYGDESRSGGALLDLHIHDVDFIHWCFGPPDSVSTTGSLRHLTTQYRFVNGPDHVMAEAAWDLNPGAGFRMRYLVNFEKATADFDLARAHPLMVHDVAGSRAIELPPSTGYDSEIRHILDGIITGQNRLRASLVEARAVMETLEAERTSLSTHQSATVSHR